MKSLKFAIGLVILSLYFTSCNENNTIAEIINEPDAPVWTYRTDDVELGTADFETFEIEHDYSPLKEKVYSDPENKMYVENNEFEEDVKIEYKGREATYTQGNSSTYKVQANGAHVNIKTSKNTIITISGESSDGSLTIEGDNKVRINLMGVNLKNTNGPAINNQSEKACFIVTSNKSVLSNDSVDVITDKEEKMKGCIHSKGKMAISGEGQLKIVANGSDAIHSAKSIFVRRGTNIDIESHAANAIKAKNNVTIEGGMINIYSTGHGGSGISAKKEVNIAGGRTTIISNTGYGKNGKNARGIKSDSIVSITGGIVRIKESSVGGKGIRAGHKFHAKNCIVDVLTYGEDDKVTGSKNRGIKGTDEVRLDSARVRIRTENGWNEGISSRYKIVINNSLVEVKTRDDAISAGEEGKADIEINNSHIYVVAGMDGIDSNGTIHFNSGIVFAIAQSNSCRGFDCDAHEFKVGPEAIMVSLGDITSHPTADLLEHPACLVTHSLMEPEFCISTSGENKNLISFRTPRFRIKDNDYTVLFSHPGLKSGTSYDISRKAVISAPEHTFHGLLIGGNVDSKSVASKHVMSRTYMRIPEAAKATPTVTRRDSSKINAAPTVQATEAPAEQPSVPQSAEE